MIKIKIDERLEKNILKKIGNSLIRIAYVSLLTGSLTLGYGCSGISPAPNPIIQKAKTVNIGETLSSTKVITRFDYKTSRRKKINEYKKKETQSTSYNQCREALFCVSDKSFDEEHIQSCYSVLGLEEMILYDGVIGCVRNSCSQYSGSEQDQIKGRLECVYTECFYEMTNCILGKQEGEKGCYDTINCVTNAPSEDEVFECMDSSTLKAKEILQRLFITTYERCKTDSNCLIKDFLKTSPTLYQECMRDK